MLKLKNQRPKYQITHPTGKIAQTDNVTLNLHYNVQPWVGLLTWNMNKDFFLWKTIEGGKSKYITLPSIKAKDKDGKSKDTKTKSKAKP